MKSLFWLHQQTKCHADQSEVEKSSKQSLKSVAAPLPEVHKLHKAPMRGCGRTHIARTHSKRRDLKHGGAQPTGMD